MKKPEFDLELFSKTNLERCNDPAAFNCGDKTNLYWVTALIEELGEIAGIVKKLERGFNQREFLKTKNKILKETQLNDDFTKTDRAIFAALEYDNPTHQEKVQAIWLANKLNELGKEIADVFTYLDLFCSKNNINLWENVKEKFNQVSDEMKCTQYKI